MSEWTRPAQPVRCVVELDKPLAVYRERGVLAQGDANANAIVAEVYSTAGKPYDLSGCTMQLIFVRPDNNALPAINAEISRNTATATLPDSAYAMSGMYSLRMQLRKNGAERTIVWIIGEVKGTDVDGIADPEHVISIGDIMASAKEAQTAASAANTAAQRANAGAERAEQLQIDASGLAGDSNKLGSKPPEYYLPAVQLLANNYFVDPVNQRGVTSVTGYAYFIDRWTTEASEDNAGEISIVKGEGVSIRSVGGGYLGIIQKIPINIAKLYENKAITFAYCDTNGNIYTGNGYLGGSAGGVNVGGLKIYSHPFASTHATIYVRNQNANTTVSLRWFAVYVGTYTAATLPPFVPPDPVLELEKCRRRFRNFKTKEGNKTFAIGFARSTTQLVFTMNVDGLDVSNLPLGVPSFTQTGRLKIIGNDKTIKGVTAVLDSFIDGVAKLDISTDGLTAGYSYLVLSDLDDADNTVTELAFASDM